MNRSIEASLSPWQLGLNSPVLRIPYRPPTLRHGDFEDKFDFQTVFYDCFWSADGSSLQLIGPPLQNLAADLHPRYFAMPSGEELKPTSVARVFICSLTIPAPRTLQCLRIESAAGTTFITPQPNLSSLFGGRRVLMTLSQNNELEWIRDWVIHHKRLHGCDAAIVYDNNSTRYDVSELRGCLAGIPGVTGLAMNWPYRYGPFDGRLPLTYDLWEGHFCQLGMLEHARYRFLATSACCLNLDIDELVYCPNGESICDLTEDSKTGHLKFSGKWVETHRSSGIDPSKKPLHRDFWHRKKGRTQGCENKYSVVPSRVPHVAQFAVHDIWCYADSTLKDGIEIRHFKALNTNWAVDRPGSMQERTKAEAKLDELEADVPLKNNLKKTFARVPRELASSPAKDKATTAYQLRQKSAQLVRTNRLTEAEAMVARAIDNAPAWPALQLYRAMIQEKLGNTTAAKATRERAARRQDKDGRSSYERGRHHLHRNEWGKAARLFRRAINLSPNFAPPYAALASLYIAAGRSHVAEGIYRRGVSHASSYLLHMPFAEFLLGRRRAAEALWHADKAIALAPTDGATYLMRAKVLRALNRPDEALAAADRAMELHGDLTVLIEQIGAAIDRPFEIGYPYFVDTFAQMERVRCLLHLGDLKGADEQSRKMIANHPDRAHPYEVRYLVLDSLGQKKQAKQHLEKAIRLARREAAKWPSQSIGRSKEREWYEDRLMFLWYLLLCANRPNDAIAALEEGLKHYPESYVTAVQLSHLLSSGGHKKKLKALVADMAQRFPRSADLLVDHGRFLEEDDDQEGATEAYRRAAKMGTRQSWALSHLAQLIIQSSTVTASELAEAEALLHKSLEIDDANALSYYRLGEVLKRKGAWSKAVDCWRHAIELAPHEAWLWSHLGGELLERRKLAEADHALRHAAELKADDMLTQFRLGRLAEEKGNMDDARTHMARSLEIDGSQAWAWRHYANLLSRLGRNAEANKALIKGEARAKILQQS